VANEQVLPDDLALAERLRRAIGDFVRVVRAQADTPTTARLETLDLLDRAGALTTAALAQRRHVKHQSMRLVIEQLERDGLVEKTADPQDRRGQLIVLRLEGRAALAQDRQARALWIATALRDHIGSEGRRDLERAIGLLERLAEDAVRTRPDRSAADRRTR
jgi:DNA-binding MarR family transcriptional regulator